MIEVWDVDPHLPTESQAELDAESGRGLWLVGKLTTKWGSYPAARGKVVWGEIAVSGG
ncbi:ATP-binding protein [Streptomyces spongiicola]|uniref:ATP-binding protein n=1 Tax=Streptomyces spongiicola TaxID=1690221 RepID=UPI0011C1B41E|nr:ATP-binding protein [Streptomyces spongiicola]